VPAFWLVWLLGHLIQATASAQPTPAAATDCVAAATAAEQIAGLPAGLLLAVGQVESGRRNPGTGSIEPWPWSANFAGAGHYFAALQEAVAWVAAQQALGGRSIDVDNWTPKEVVEGPSLWGHERLWLPPEGREKARELRTRLAEEGLRIPLDVMEGNHKIAPGTCALWDGIVEARKRGYA